MYTGAAGIYANRAANSSLRGTNLTSISCPCAPIMKQTLPEKQPSAINQEQRGINAEWGEGGENFRFRTREEGGRETRRGFFPLHGISNFPWNEMKKMAREFA